MKTFASSYEPLPVDAVIPDLRAALEGRTAVVLQAPPGSGKTTRVPLALLDAPFLQSRKIVMLEPRRLAAVNAAAYMSHLLHEQTGARIGYQVRLDRRISAATQVEVVTEGILTRRLQSDPGLEDVGIVIFDEFHERNLEGDLALALCRDIQRSLREDLRILIMSATLDSAPIAHFLDDAPIISCESRSFPVDLRYLHREPEGRVADYTARGIASALRETEGDVLAFLPGMREIMRCRQLLSEIGPQPENLLICPLHGDLPLRDQERAIRPAAGRRKVVLSTTIAETSLTIEGVRVVVDSGFARRGGFNQGAGLPLLETVRVSAASADQRAGRAGRLGPGICYRLWTEQIQRHLIPFHPPEIAVADLADLALQLALWGVRDVRQLHWLTPPPEAHLAAARELLQELDALTPEGGITATGRKIGTLGVHPRLGRLLLEGVERDVPLLAADLAALLAERDILRSPAAGPTVTPSDLLDRVEALAAARRGRLPADAAGVQGVLKLAERLARLVAPGGRKEETPTADDVSALLAAGFPDRIGRRREGSSERYLFSSGKGGVLSPRTGVRTARYLVAPLLEMRGGSEATIVLASGITLSAIRDVLGSRIRKLRTVAWDDREGRVVGRREERLGALVLGAETVVPEPEETVQALLGMIRQKNSILRFSTEAQQFRGRVALMRRHFPDEEWPDLSDSWLQENLDEWLAGSLYGVRSRQEVERIDLAAALKELLPHRLLRRLDECVPTRVTAPSGSRIAVDYAEGEPVLAVKLQELFGLAETPAVACGRQPLLLHLLSPAGRPIQVTRDLRNFWDTGYLEVRKELRGRYPRHPWPDDPWAAQPTRHVKRRS